MKRFRTKAAAVGLTLVYILTAPGFDAFQALAAVTVQQHIAAPVTGPAQIGAMGMLAPGSAGVLSPSLAPINLKASLSVPPAPDVQPRTIPSAPPLSALAAAAPPSIFSAEGTALNAHILSPAIVSPAAPAFTALAEEARTALGDLAAGATRIATGARQDGSGQAQRQAVDELFLGRSLSAPAGVLRRR